jgi:hypothetical protein
MPSATIFNHLIPILIIFLLVNCQNANDESEIKKLVSDRTRAEFRDQFRTNLINNQIESVLKKDLNDNTESQWQGAFWAMGLARYRSPVTDRAVKYALDKFDQSSDVFLRALMEVVYTLYPDTFKAEVYRIADHTNNTKIFAMCAKYLQDLEPNLEQILNSKFENWHNDPILSSLHQDLFVKKPDLPQLVDLLRHPFPTPSHVVFSIQRPDRRYPGLALIRDPDGQFLRTETDQLFAIKQLTLSNSNLPGYLTNGNTPQGIFAIQGVSVSENIFIGPTPTLQLVMPFEATMADYFYSAELKNMEWQISRYRELLPETWGDYWPVYQAYYAGKAGRTEIIAHGSTIDPEFYRNEPFYPLTPSLGCMTAYEQWDPESGKCLYSGQLELITRLKKQNTINSFFIVIETEPADSAISVLEIEEMIYHR